MIWKNQESWEIWLDEFWDNRHSNMQKKASADNFFWLRFLAAIMDLQIALKY